MSYLRYHHILLIGIMVEKCENWGGGGKKNKKNNLVSQALFFGDTLYYEALSRKTMFHPIGNVFQIVNSK